ncbi:unnamed protein product [Musa acuminata subsp. malaccensis]|uniref:Auxin-responsive protein n=1 Tax=Musa acuminata subsp. malaccensis TaxID=214687 RepID=A0A804KTR4_MUSAM|nr:PREDICTED: auxin-responsive protein IAA10-like isoform X1 [Musa acuminata subsp. malaccensis]CAG1852858.1 unnamed protein product [Musa acuminata subsp. malaccensis]
MQGVCGFDGGVASPESVSSVSKAAVAATEGGEEEGLVVDDVHGGAVGEREEEREVEVSNGEELELGLTLGAARKAKAAPARRGACCRILTAKDFPSLAVRASRRSHSGSLASSSSGTNRAGGTAGTKRAAESVSPDVGGSPHPPSQMVVGWPPIRAFRMNNLFTHPKDTTALKKADVDSGVDSTSKTASGSRDQEDKGCATRSSFFVKVKMDGDPIGRKVDLSAHHSYETLAVALELMFHKPTMAFALATAAHGAKVSKLLDASSEFALTYEDKDGDWMLVGDVPWGMFLETVKRLRIMRTSDANGLSQPVHFGKLELYATPGILLSFNTASGSIGSSPA